VHVVLIEPSGRRGLDHYVYCLGNALAERGHRVLLLTGIGHETAALRARYQAVELFDRFRTGFARLLRGLLALRREGVDVVHLHGAIHPELYAPFLWLARTVLRCPVVYSAHDVLPFKHALAGGLVGPVLTGPLTGLVYRLADAVVVHAEENRRYLLGRFRLPPGTVHVAPIGNYAFLEELAGPTPPAPRPDVRRVLFFGVVVESKGLMALIRAFEVVAARIPPSRLTVVGRPFQDVRPYLAEIRRLGLTDRVETEFREVAMAEIPRYFRETDVVALPYRNASQSAVVQVAYAFARPVVATAVGGLAEVVEHRKTGLVVPPNDERALAEALVELLTDDTLRTEMGGYARELSRDRYSWDRVASKIEDAYASARRVAEERRGEPGSVA
jgi:glycosyltransferase involved in cell wall biosynthesis